MARDGSQQQEHIFNPTEHLIQIKNKGGDADYLPVQWRLVWFRDVCPQGTIETEVVLLDMDRETEEEAYVWNNATRRSEKTVKRANGLAVFHATVKDGKGGIATGTKSEKAASFPDWIEKAETGSIGRALAALGFGTQFTGDEFDEKHRIVDAPVDRGSGSEPAEPEPEIPSVSPVPGKSGATRKSEVKTAPAPEPQVEEGAAADPEIGTEDLLPEKARMVIYRLKGELGEYELKHFMATYLKLRPGQNLYDPGIWQGETGQALIELAVKSLDLWLKGEKRGAWLKDAILPEQKQAIANALPEGEYGKANPRPIRHFREAYLANPVSVQSLLLLDALSKAYQVGELENLDETARDRAYKDASDTAIKIMAEVISLDKEMHGKRISQLTRGEADRYLSYFDPKLGGYDEGFASKIPDEFLYKGQKQAAA